MQKKTNNLDVMKRFLLYLLSLLGFGLSSCAGGNLDAYGVPHINFRLSARVIDESGEPIQGIEARPCRNRYDERFDDKSGYSDYQGYIEAYGRPSPGTQYTVRFIDEDGELNGGKFETLTLDIKDKVVQTADGEGGWNDGSFEAELGDVTLKRVENDEDEKLDE